MHASKINLNCNDVSKFKSNFENPGSGFTIYDKVSLKSQNKKLVLSTLELLCLCRKSENSRITKATEVYFKKKLSLEHILIKMGEFEKVKYLLLEKEELQLLKFIKSAPVFKSKESPRSKVEMLGRV